MGDNGLRNGQQRWGSDERRMGHKVADGIDVWPVQRFLTALAEERLWP
jgi:hypothetical protein